MSYKIIYTEESEQDLVNIYRHIATNLLAPENAKKQVDRIMEVDRMGDLPSSIARTPIYNRIEPFERNCLH